MGTQAVPRSAGGKQFIFFHFKRHNESSVGNNANFGKIKTGKFELHDWSKRKYDPVFLLKR